MSNPSNVNFTSKLQVCCYFVYDSANFKQKSCAFHTVPEVPHIQPVLIPYN